MAPSPEQDASSTALGVGSEVDHFRILRLLGRGGMGEVYLARDLRLGRRVALKLVHPDRLGSPDAARRFLEEARITAEFSHPHIVTVYGVGETPEGPYVALEYLEGQTLRERLSETRLSPREVARLGLAIAEALAEAHAHGVTHRDLKPENVLLPKDGRPRVVDFGLARREHSNEPDIETALGAVRAPPTTRAAMQTAGRAVMESKIFAEGAGTRAAPSANTGDETTILAGGAVAGAGARAAPSASTGDEATILAGGAAAGAGARAAPSASAGDEATILAGGAVAGAGTVGGERVGANASAAPGMVRARVAPDGRSFPGTGGPAREGSSGISGTPRYMAPEQWAQQGVGASADVWALGIMLFELLSGSHPWEGRPALAMALLVTDPEPAPRLSLAVPTELIELVADCLRKAPLERPLATDVADRLRRWLGQRSQSGEPAESPFRGLLPFTERQADRFHGRQDEIVAFLERLREEALLPVVGPSGAGKSSFVQAGVVPRLREQGHWLVLSVRPGADPFRALASRLMAGETTGAHTPSSVRAPPVAAPSSRGALRPEGLAGVPEITTDADPVDALAALLRAVPGRLGLRLHEIAERSDARVLLVVDQLEELCTQGADAETRRSYLACLASAADDAAGPVRVILTARDDYLGRLAEGAEARRCFGRVTVLRSPGPEALREILVRPVAQAGFGWEDDALAGEITEALQGEAAALPLLQVAGQHLWEHRDTEGRRLTRAAYDAMGGVAGALAQHADHILAGLTPAQERVARDIFLRLVTAEGTRRLLPRDRVLDGLPAEGPAVLERLTRERAILQRRAPGDRSEKAEPELELVHESLITRWARLATWIDEARGELAFLSEIGQATALWERRGARVDDAWRGPELSEAQRRLARVTTVVPEAVRRFVAAGLRRERRRQRILRWSLGAIILVLAGLGAAAGVTSWALSQRTRAAVRQQRLTAQQREAARHRFGESQLEGADAALRRDDVLEAKARLRSAFEMEDSTFARGLWWQIVRDPLVWKLTMPDSAYRPVFSPDGRTIAVGLYARMIFLVDVATRETSTLSGTQAVMTGVDFSPDGRRLAYGSASGDVGIWDLATRTHRALPSERGLVFRVRFSPNGSQIAVASWGGTVRLLDAATGELIHRFTEHGGRVHEVLFLEGGKVLASGGDDTTVRFWDLATGKQRRALTLGRRGDAVLGLDATPDERTLVACMGDRTLQVLDLTTGAVRHRIDTTHSGALITVDLDPIGRTAAVSSIDGGISLWDLASGRNVGRLVGHVATVVGLAYSPDGQTLVSAGDDAKLRLWSVNNQGRDHGRKIANSTGYSVAFSGDGRTLAVASHDGKARLYDVARGEVTKVLEGHQGILKGVSLGASGRQLATASWDGTIRLWDLDSGTARRVLAGDVGEINGLTFDPAGTRIASADGHGTVRLWDATSGALLKRLSGHRAGVLTVAFSPDGARVASGSQDGSTRLWDARTGAPLAVLGTQSQPVKGVVFEGKGNTILAGSSDGTLRRYGPPGVQTELRRFASGITALDAHPTDGRIGVATIDGAPLIWDPRTGAELTLRGHRDVVYGLRFSPDGRRAATCANDGTVRLWDARSGRPLWRGPFLRAHPDEAYTHRGWVSLGVPARPIGMPDAAWRRAVETRALNTVSSPDGRAMCLLTQEGAVEHYLLSGDQGRELRRPGGDVTGLVAHGTGCAVLARSLVTYYPRAGAPRPLATDASLIAPSRRGLLVARKNEVHSLDVAGRLLGVFQVRGTATALCEVPEGVAVAYLEGGLVIVTRNGSVRPLESPDNVVALALHSGPRNTLALGGVVGAFWLLDQQSGRLLLKRRLQGPVTHLAQSGSKILGLTEVGDHEALDLSILDRPYCDLLREVWAAVPVVWEGGRLVRREPPRKHACHRP